MNYWKTECVNEKMNELRDEMMNKLVNEWGIA